MKRKVAIQREITRLKLYGNNHNFGLFKEGMIAALHWVTVDGFVSPSNLMEMSVPIDAKRKKRKPKAWKK